MSQATSADIARQLHMTVSGARQHLAALVDEGLAEATERPRPAGQRGRPQLEYTVTASAPRSNSRRARTSGGRPPFTSSTDAYRSIAIPVIERSRLKMRTPGDAPGCTDTVMN